MINFIYLRKTLIVSLLKMMMVTSIFIISGISYLVYKEYVVYGYRIVVSNENLMCPSICEGNIVISKLEALENYSVGDVFVLKSPVNVNKYIVRRIKDEQKGDFSYFVTVSDYAYATDAWKVTDDLIIGRVVYTLPYIGYFAQIVHKPIGLILFVLLPSVVLVHKELINFLSIALQNIKLLKRKRPNIYKNKNI